MADIEQELYRFEKTLNAHTADIRSLERSVERLEGRIPAEPEAVDEFVTAMHRVGDAINEGDGDDDAEEPADPE